jgi:tRNA1(Val) A37 N6-methylase TrmN6
MLALLPINLDDYTIVDIGSGKGKLLLLASNYPFRRIIGVEYAPLLHEIAKKTSRTFGHRHRNASISPRCAVTRWITGCRPDRSFV